MPSKSPLNAFIKSEFHMIEFKIECHKGKQINKIVWHLLHTYHLIVPLPLEIHLGFHYLLLI